MLSIKNNKPNPNSVYKQGYYKLENEAKYASADKTIIFRSSLEFKFCKLVDKDPKVKKWASEPFPIPYIHPFEKSKSGGKKICQYFFDYYVEIQTVKGLEKFIIEVKPISMLRRPEPINSYATLKQKQTYNKKLRVISVNIAKYKAASEFCKSKGLKYIFLTESFFEKFYN